MKFLVIFIAILFVGCRAEDRVDISKLVRHDRILFTRAAHTENIDVTEDGDYWDWKVRYNNNLKKAGNARSYYFMDIIFCEISLNPNEMPVCDPGGYDRGFYIISRHELKHCKGRGHSDDESNIMNKNVPCWPTN